MVREVDFLEHVWANISSQPPPSVFVLEAFRALEERLLRTDEAKRPSWALLVPYILSGKGHVL